MIHKSRCATVFVYHVQAVPATPTRIDLWIKGHLKADAPHCRSLIVTIFGDSVAPYSDGVWLSDLIELLAPFGTNERLVRTSVFRLAADGWLSAAREGRRSYYTLAPGGRRRFQHAYQRVYTPQPEWDGKWTVVLVPGKCGIASRARMREELEWEGYASVAPGVFARPGADPETLSEVLDDLGLGQQVVVLSGAVADSAAVGNLVHQGWNVAAAAKRYSAFIRRFQPLMNLLERDAAIVGAEAFLAQTLLIDSFRRLSLHDPRLPHSLLPPDWPGRGAYELCRQIYRRTFKLVRTFVLPRIAKDKPAVQVPTEVLRRFGGLQGS